MKHKGLRVRFPRSADEARELNVWLKSYNLHAEDYNTVHLKKIVGSSDYTDDVIRFHDHATGATDGLRLA